MSITDSPKNRSYSVRDAMAQAIGAPLHDDWTTSRYGYAIACIVPLPGDGPDDEPVDALLLHTSNAGFRGIEGWFEDSISGRKFTRSLGDVLEWEAEGGRTMPQGRR